MKIKVWYYTNRGLKRENNEDSLSIDGEVFSEISFEETKYREIDKNIASFMVADGMGGHNRGEIASSRVLKFLSSQKLSSKEEIIEGIYEAKKSLNSLVKKDNSLFGLGTTICGVSINGDKTYIFNSGDSRIYYYNSPFLEQISYDHSLVQKLVESGAIKVEEMRFHYQKNILTSAIVGDETDRFPEVYVKELKSKNSIFILCSDGVWESMSIEAFEESFKKRKPYKKIIKNVFEYGANDNLSFIILKVEI